MDLRRLRYFVAVAEELHFGNAARRLNVSQPPLSQQIHKLEQELGVSLFDRNRRRVRLTYAGSLFLDKARIVLQDVEDALSVARRAHGGELGHLVIGHAPPADLNILPRAVSAFRAQYPLVTLALKNMGGPDLVRALLDQRIRIALLRLPIDHPLLVVIPILKERLVAVLPKSHKLARSKTIKLADLSGESFVMFPRQRSPGYFDILAKFCLSEGGFNLTVTQETDAIQTVLALVAAGLGVSLQPASVQILHRPGVVCKPIHQSPACAEMGIAYLADDRSRIVQNFVNVVAKLTEA
jgi:DNA-binding transcriptional LysR family regulator